MPGTTCLFASRDIGAVAQTMAVFGLAPLEEMVGKPPGIPPLPPSPAEATSALLATKVTIPAALIVQARRHSFSPQTKSMGPRVGLFQNMGEPCRWWVLPS